MFSQLEEHVKTHSIRAAEDSAAVAVLETFLRSGGKINTNFASNDKWPNSDGTFEFVPNPLISRRPQQNFIVQIKGTHSATTWNGGIKYNLTSLGFPAEIACNVTADPGILFVVLNPDVRGEERVFWKYMSVEFLATIDGDNKSKVITFDAEAEIKNTEESINLFCKKLEDIIEHHSFIKKISDHNYNRHEIERIIKACDRDISESIDRMEIFNETRDEISQRILVRLTDFCEATLLLNELSNGAETVNIPLAWEHALMNIETKYLCSFYRGLKYVGNRIPEEGQAERLMLKYYSFLWQIRQFLYERYGMSVLQNLEKIPTHTDLLDQTYYDLVAPAVNAVSKQQSQLGTSRFYIQKKVPFFVGKERYFEITLQLAGAYASKYNRLTVYTKSDISTDYTIQVGCIDANINLWDIDVGIKVVTNWRVSIDPTCLNKLARILCQHTRLSSQYGEYEALMRFLTRTGLNLLELIDLKEVKFASIVNDIFEGCNTEIIKGMLIMLRDRYSKTRSSFGKNIVRYVLMELRESDLLNVLPDQFDRPMRTTELYVGKSCYPFERNPFISNLSGKKTSTTGQIRHIINVTGEDKANAVRPYLILRNQIKQTGEIYFEANTLVKEDEINQYNSTLDQWEREKGFEILKDENVVFIKSYQVTTREILRKLQSLSNFENSGQREFNANYLRTCGIDFEDKMKEQALRDLFVKSRILLIYGAAGTGKTTLINYISNMMGNYKKLFLTKTHAARQNLQRRIDNPGPESEFVSMDSFTNKVSVPEFDVVFVDECSTIDNLSMYRLLDKLGTNSFLVLAGDIHQIESIDFGNWFFYAKDIIHTMGSNVELLSTWRTDDQNLIGLWDEVRKKGDRITEFLAMDGPYSEDISPAIFKDVGDDEVVLCLNYDGKFGLNNINRYFQNANTKHPAVTWHEWTYKVGDRILFNENKRFKNLYNNLKGRIAEIQKEYDRIIFTIDVERIIPQAMCQNDDLEFVSVLDGKTRIRLSVFDYMDPEDGTDNEDRKRKSSIPFQLAYAVSIHKAQGLEYDSVKVVIPSSNAERITHGIFYTAITRAKKKLKIYWSAETMEEVVHSFSEESERKKSLEIIKTKLGISN